jgi:uncharacterized RDD family membrane protein YckC
VDAPSKLIVETPEQIGIEFEIAGLGSRFLAALVDLACMLLFLIIAVVLAFTAMTGSDERGKSIKQLTDNAAHSQPWTHGLGAAAAILLLLSVFAVLWGYYIICEMVTGGASPGKRALGLRVIRDNGLPIGFTQSLLRNLVRIVDFLPWVYGVGLVAVFVSRRSQRLGDLVAGTLVVRLAADGHGPLGAMPGAPAAATPPGSHPLTPAERDLVARFLARSGTLAPEARRSLARQIAAPLRRRLGEAGTAGDEEWLSAMLAAGWRR